MEGFSLIWRERYYKNYDFHDLHGFSWNFLRFLWIFYDFNGFSVDVHGFSMVFNEFPWIFIDFFIDFYNF